MNKLRILFVLPSFAGGGAERVVITLVRHLDRQRFTPVLAVVNPTGPYAADVPADVETHHLGVRRFREGLWKLVRLTRSVKPDVVFSTMDYANLATLLVSPFFPRGTRVVIRQTEVLSRYLRGRRRALVLLYRMLYGRADRIVCQSGHMARELTDRLNLDAGKLVRIYNPLDVRHVQHRAKQGQNPFLDAGPGPHLVVAGRLAPEKAPHRIIEKLPEWTRRYPDLRLWFLGEGGLESELRERAERLGVDRHVRFPGFQENPYAWFRFADTFVLSSVYEGSPNALLEALACGCPALILDHPGGTREIAEHAGPASCRMVKVFPDDLEPVFSDSRTPPDLSAFEVETAIRQFETVLAA